MKDSGVDNVSKNNACQYPESFFCGKSMDGRVVSAQYQRRERTKEMTRQRKCREEMAEGRINALSAVQIKFIWERPLFLSSSTLSLSYLHMRTCRRLNGDSSTYAHHPLLHLHVAGDVWPLYKRCEKQRVRKIGHGNRAWTPPRGQDKQPTAKTKSGA